MKTLEELVQHLTATGMPASADFRGKVPIRGVNTLEDAGSDEISFLANEKYRKMLETTKAGAVVVTTECETPKGLNVIRTADPYAAITILIVHLHGYRQHPQWGTSPTAKIATSVTFGDNANVGPNVTIGEHTKIGRNATIYPGVYIADHCLIGDNVTLYPNVVIYEGSILGHRVAIHAGTVIGEDGLGYAPVEDKWVKIPQAGRVMIADDVEIGANCAIDRATLGQTIVGHGTKFSNLIAVGHGTKIGEHCLFVAQVGVAGSVTVGDHVKIAGQAGLVGHISIGDHANIGAKSGVTNDVAAKTTVLGQPAVLMAECKRQFAMVQRLPEMRKEMRQIPTILERVTALEFQNQQLQAALREALGEAIKK
jgi:UDP-3-O-[3-hydroxymyristoyl] glucosamine N-acyltransferase